ncbi:MAG: hypothetical protein P1U46_01125 [Patescibacteria group bacterium]|nr:hypothetical protein [Patescibacteria group bacterium]
MSDFLILDDDKKDESSSGSNNIINDKSLIIKLNDYFISVQKVNTKQKVIFYRLLSTMTNA